MLITLFTVFPFFVCFFWSAIYILRWLKQNAAQHILGIFAMVCSVLYGCHAQFFMGEQSELGEWLWMTCSLAVYPLYYIYIIRLTTSRPHFPWSCIGLLIPALILPTLEYFFPVVNDLHLRQIFMAAIVLFVCVSGIITLNKFEHDIENFYADTEGKSSHPIKILLILFTLCSTSTVVVSSIGREFFQESTLLIIPSVVFSILLFTVLYLGDRYTFDGEEMLSEESKEQHCPEECCDSEQTHWIAELERQMQEEKLYLEPKLKIADLASRVGTCRTYISQYINQQKGVSFSDYINEQRIRYAEQLLKEDPTLSIEYLSTATGFSNEQSFMRNFRKFSTQNLHK